MKKSRPDIPAETRSEKTLWYGSAPPNEPVPTPGDGRSYGYVHGVFLALIFVSMVIWTWGTWPDPVIDFGRELYVPWQLSEGKVLYRDITYFQGPLSAYTHAALFKIFGVSLRTLVVFNVGVAAGIATLLWRTARRLAGEYAATVATIVFFCCFAFCRLGSTGNYNYICAYSYEVPHGVFLALASLAALDRAIDTNRKRWYAVTGLLCGLLALTKLEYTLAGLAAVGVKFAIAGAHARSRRFAGNALVAFGMGTVPVLVAFVLLATAMPARDAAVGVAGSWAYVFDRSLVGNPFFKALMGTDYLSENLTFMALLFAFGVSVVALLVALARYVKPPAAASLTAAGLGIAIYALAGIPWDRVDWRYPSRALTPAAATLIVVWLVRLAKQWRDDRGWAVAATGVAFAVFAQVMLFRMLFIPKIEHYGFALAMPSTFLVIVALVGNLPAWVAATGGSATLVRMPLTVLALVICQFCVAGTAQVIPLLDAKVGTGADRFMSDTRGMYIQQAADLLKSQARPGETMLVVPEGIMVNYLSRLPTPTRHLNFIPTSLIMFGEEKMLADLQAKPPDWVTVVSFDQSEYGVDRFGKGYGLKLNEWIQRDYETIGHFRTKGEDEPPPFEIHVMHRRSGR